MAIRDAATTVDSISNTPVTAVMSFNGMLIAVQVILAVTVVAWEWIGAGTLATIEPAIAFGVALIWLPFKKYVLPWLM